MMKRETAAEYRRLADQSSALAAASALDHVRAKHERSAAVWAGLADGEEHRWALVQHRRQELDARSALTALAGAEL
jgi:hypothetical protein